MPNVIYAVMLFMLDVIYVVCHLCKLLFVLDVIYAIFWM